MKIQSNMYINNHNMTSRNIEKKENGSHALCPPPWPPAG